MAELFGELFMTQEQGTKSKLKVIEEEVTSYREVDCIPLDADPLTWWKTKELIYPHVAMLARCYLAVLGTSVPSERVFSTAADIFTGGLLTLLGSLGMVVWLSMTPHNPETEKKRLAILAGFAFFTGVGLGPAMDFVIIINPSIIVTAFLGTSIIFVCFTLSALYAKRRSFLFLGGTLMSGLSVLFLVSVVNMFFGSAILFKAHMYLGLVIMCGFVLFDTQLIIEKAENGDKDYIWHCVDLFLDFVTIFRKLMILLAMNEKDKKKEKK
ncbi:probable Bax inhibitor 1 isoform X1 [Oncorhynchus kisutch]|uniref:probable Bax inhibitor 1 isoform X1 n=1 Tax=Oncorhynchus kisutch TaxID=8019 RepID=UPI0012DCE272|nr:probable Bax inhibitor 1 isoform X1 [Oncorhynchus kisutch]